METAFWIKSIGRRHSPTAPLRLKIVTAASLAFAVVAGACAPTSVPSSSPVPTQAAVEPTVAHSLEPAVADAMEFREQYGLRADEDWIRSVAKDPTSRTLERYGVPLLPAEVADLQSRRWPNTLITQLREYGLQFPEDFATAYINQKASGAIIEFKENLDFHRAALAALPLDGPILVQQAEFSIKDLREGLAKVEAERAWIEATGAKYVQPTIYELENRVVIVYDGGRGLAPIITNHFGNPGWLETRREGP
jgi:hypothetical protein